MMYGVLVSIVYVTQLGVVIPHELRGDGDLYKLLACCSAGQFMTGIDLLGYTLMSLSTLLAAPVFDGAGLRRVVSTWLFANGLLAPFLIMQLAYPKLIFVGALWLVTFPLAMLFLALLFRQAESEKQQ